MISHWDVKTEVPDRDRKGKAEQIQELSCTATENIIFVFCSHFEKGERASWVSWLEPGVQVCWKGQGNFKALGIRFYILGIIMI